jgi:hypothetical protein
MNVLCVTRLLELHTVGTGHIQAYALVSSIINGTAASVPKGTMEVCTRTRGSVNQLKYEDVRKALCPSSLASDTLLPRVTQK